MIIIVGRDSAFVLDNYDKLTLDAKWIELERKYPVVNSSGYAEGVRYDVNDYVRETIYSDNDIEKVKAVYNGIIDAIADSRTVNTIIKIADILADV